MNKKPTFDLRERINSTLSFSSAPAVRMQEGGEIKTFSNDPEYFNNRTFEDWQVKLLSSGNFGIDPNTDTIIKLKSPVNVPQEWLDVTGKNYKGSETQRRYQAEAGLQQAYQNPVMYAPGSIGLGAGAGAALKAAAPAAVQVLNAPMQVAGRVLPAATPANLMTAAGAASAPENIASGVSNIRQGNYLQGAADLGTAALDVAVPEALNVAKPLSKLLSKKSKKLLSSSKSSEQIEKEMEDYFDEIFRHSSLPELNNPQASGVLEDFRARLMTPEGQRRLKQLGITETDILDNLKIVADENTLGNYWRGKISLNPDLPEFRYVARHEVEHGVQDAYKESNLKEARKFRFLDLLLGPSSRSERVSKASSLTDIDKSLEGLELRKTPEDVDWKEIKSKEKGNNRVSDFYRLLADKQRATNYFASGSGGQEKSAFLAEVQQYMMDTGILPKKSYKEVTPEMVKETFVDAMFDEERGGKSLRLFNIMKATDKNYKLIADNLNKMLAIIPAAATGVDAMQQGEVQNKQQGGVTSRLQQLMGYKDNSPYKNLPYQDIYSDRITMQGVSRPLVAKTDTGVTTVMQPGEEYYFPGASKVREIPMYKNGGELKDRENFQQMKQNTYINPLTRQLGKSIRKFQNSGNTSSVNSGKVDKKLNYAPKNEDEAWMKFMLGYEDINGLSTGGHKSFGINNQAKYKEIPNNMEDAVRLAYNYLMNEQQKNPQKGIDLRKLPLSVRQRVGDYIFNSGRNPRHLLLLSSGLITLDEINDTTPELNKIKDQYGEDSNQYKAAIENHTKKLNSLWEKNGDQILKNIQNDPEAFSKSLDSARHEVAKTTGGNDVNYETTWRKRIDMWGVKDKLDKQYDQNFVTSPEVIQQVASNENRNSQKEPYQWDEVNNQIAQIAKTKKVKTKSTINQSTSQTTSTTPAAKDTSNPSTTKENKVVEWDKNGTAKGNFVLSNEAEIGSTIKLKDPNTGQTIEAKVLGRIPEGVYDKNTKIVMSPDLGKTLKLDTRGANGTAVTRINLEAEYMPIPTPSQPAAANNNQQANTQPPATNTVPTAPAAPNQGSTQVAVPPATSTGSTGTSSNATANPPATSTAPAADDYTVLESEVGDPYEYRYNEKTGKYETRKKGSSSWIVLDDSTDRLKEARKAIEGRYGEQVKKVQEETAKSSAAPVGTGTGTGTGAGAGAAGTTTKPKTWQEDVASREWKEPIEVDSTYKGSGFFRPDRMYVLPEEGPKDAWWNRPGQSQPSRPQGTTSGTTPPSTNTPSGSTVIPPSSIRRSEIREFPGRIFDPIPEEQDRTVPGLKDRNPIMRERPYEILEPDMPGNQGSVGQGGASGATDKRNPVNIPTLPTSPLKPINPSQSSSASIPTPTVKDNAVRIGNVDFSKANASDNNSSDFQGWYGAGNKTFYQTEDGTIKIVTDGRGRFYLENENQLFEVDPPDSTDVKGSIKGERYYDDEQKDFVEKPNSYDDYWKSQLAYIKKEQKKGIPAKEFYGKKRADDYGSWNYKKGSFVQGGEVQEFSVGGGIAKGASTGATLGAALGTIVPGIGNVIGGAAGALIGGIAGGISGGIKQSKDKKEARRLQNNAIAAQNRASGNSSLLDLLKGNNSFSSLLMGPQNLGYPSYGQQMQGMQYNPGIQGMPMSPYMTNLMPPPFQEGAQVQQPQPSIYTNETAPTAYKTGLNQSSLEGAAYKPTELKMEYLPIPGTRNNQEQQGVKIITIYDKTTNQPRRIYVDSTGKMLGYADSQEDMYSEAINKQQSNHQDLYQLAQQWKENNQPVAQQQQGGPIITSMLYRNMDRNNSIKNNISVNKTKLQDVINLSNKVNPYRLYPGGVYKNGGMIMEGGVSASRAGFSRQPITGASSTGPLGPKRTETPDYTNKGVRSLMDLPSNEYVPTENLIPIQTEIGEMIVLPTGDLMPVMARKRHHQMQDDEVTDVTPENSYILSAHGQVRINRNEADLLITETGVKPYRLGQAQNPPTEKTLGSIMTKSIMKPAEVAKRINSLFPVLSSSNPFEIAANVENKINRKPYLEGLIQLSELDKYRKGLSEPAMSDMQQQQMQMQGQGSPMLARQGGRTISRPGIVRAQGGYYTGDPTAPGQTLDLGNYGQNNPTYWNPVGSSTPPITGATSGIPTVVVPATDPYQVSALQTDPTGTLQTRTAPGGGAGGGSNASGALSGILAPANFAARMIGAQAIRNAEKRGITRERDIYGRSFNKMGSLMGLGTGLEAAMLGAQDPFVKYTETPDTYIRTMRTQTPSQLLEAQASSAYSNLPDYSQMGAAGLGAQNAAYAQGLAASSRFLGEAAERDRANFNRQQELLQANMAQNVAGRLAAQRATDAAVNKMLSGYGNLANRYTQGLVDLTGQRMGADLGLSRAEQASKVGLYGNRLNAFTTLTGDIAAGGEGLLKFYGLGK